MIAKTICQALIGFLDYVLGYLISVGFVLYLTAVKGFSHAHKSSANIDFLEGLPCFLKLRI